MEGWLIDYNISFVALGGAQNVGNSCYFLKLGNKNILLDCGMNVSNVHWKSPNFNFLLQSGLIEDMRQISQIYISHAHWDHIGYLDKLCFQSSNTSIYMTEITKQLFKYQIIENQKQYNISNRELLYSQEVYDHIVAVNYLQKLDLNTYKVCFLEAGHIPGAMMVLLNYMGRNILYTGDYSFGNMFLTGRCHIPENLKVDTLIICGTHAKHSFYSRNENELGKKCKEVITCLEHGLNVYCKVSQLSKGVEVLGALNSYMEQYKTYIPIYVEESVWSVLSALENANISILKKWNHLINAYNEYQNHIIIGTKPKHFINNRYFYYNMDFTLHDDFEEMKNFIKKISPRQAVVVHSPDSNDVYEENIEQVLARDAYCNTQFIFPREKEIYIL